MPPVLIAFLEVAALFAVFWTTRAAPTAGRKWFLRIAGFVVLYLLAAVLAGDAQVAAKPGEYAVYLGIPAIVIYLIAQPRYAWFWSSEAIGNHPERDHA